jgi:hypothetical protein
MKAHVTPYFSSSQAHIHVSLTRVNILLILLIKTDGTRRNPGLLEVS